MSHGRPSVADVVAVMRKYPMARIAMMETIHRELGNQFAHEVSTELQDQSANTLAPQSTNTPAPLGPMGALRQVAKPVFELAKGGDLAAILKNGHTYETFADQQITTLNGVMPGYVKARNALDRDGVQQVGMVVMSSLELLRAAISGLGEQLGRHVDPLNCAPGADAAAELQGAEELGQLEALQSRHKQLVTTANHIQQTALMTMTPRDYRGSPLPNAAAPTAHVGAKGLFDVRAQVNEELVRTLTIINCAERLFIQFADPKALHDPQQRQLARHDIAAFAHRPADLTFLRAILMSAGVWQQLDGEDEHKPAAKSGPLGFEVCKESDGPLSSLYAETKKQAEQLGWLTDIGNYDRYLADLDINIGSSEGVTNVWARIMSAPADGRAQILYQMQRRGMFKPFLDKLPWHYTKELHDGLPSGHGELKTELQHYFLVKGKWGTSLENQEYHAPSLTKMIRDGGDAVGGWGESVIDGFDSALNFMTFGFTHGYGQAQDAHSQGLITDDEYATAVRQVSTRAAVGMAIMMATGGMGRGAGAAAGSSSMGAASLYPSVAGTAMATGVEGAMFATTEMFALDTTDIVTGAKDQYSDATDYLKAAMIGGTMGAAVGGTSRFLSNRVAAEYLGSGMQTRGQSLAAQHPKLSPVLEQLQAVEQGAAVDVRLNVAQTEELARAGLIDAPTYKKLQDALTRSPEIQAVARSTENLNASAGAASGETAAATSRPRVLEVFTGPDLKSPRHLASEHPGHQVVAAEATLMPSAEEIARFRAEGGEFLPERFAESLPPGTVNKIYVRYPLPHAKGLEALWPRTPREIDRLMAEGMSIREAMLQAPRNVAGTLESMTNFGPHALEKLAPGSTMEVVYWEKAITQELTELTQHTYMDAATGQRFRLEITVGPQSVPRSVAPASPGEGIPPDIETVSRIIMTKVAVP